MEKLKKTIESALFISGRWMNVAELARIVGSANLNEVKARADAIKEDLAKHDGGFILEEDNGRYRMSVAPDMREHVYYLAPEPELSPALVKTLALIAYKQPIGQSEVVRVIGNRSYDYIKELRKKEFIVVKKKGRSKMLSTTGHFRKYFDLKEGEIPWAADEFRNLEKQMKLNAPSPENAGADIDENV
jgi:segregation and condensation protein B